MHMSIENLGSMFSQRSVVQQSVGNSVMNVIVGFLAQKMIGQTQLGLTVLIGKGYNIL
jgi:hypothetical protein